MTIEALLAWLGGAKLFIASVIGGFISLNFFEKEKLADGTVVPMTHLEKWTSVVGGTAIGVFCAPSVVSLSGVDVKIAGQVEVLAGILLAMFGMSIASQFVKIVRKISWEDIVARFPGGGK